MSSSSLPSSPPEVAGANREDNPPEEERNHHDMNTDEGQKTSGEALHPGDRDSTTPTPGNQAQMPSTPPTSAMPGAGERQNGSNTINQSQTNAAPPDDSPADERISDFEWEDLLDRYHTMTEERQNEEQKVYDEFVSLVNYFTIWAHTTSFHEDDRSYKRLRTRIEHVRYSEDQLEQKRQHYMRVVAAFESAMKLLIG